MLDCAGSDEGIRQGVSGKEEEERKMGKNKKGRNEGEDGEERICRKECKTRRGVCLSSPRLI